MRFSLLALVRLISLLAVVATVAAVGLSRALPESGGGHRAAVAPRYVGVNGSAFTPTDPRNFLLDTETGRLDPVAAGPDAPLVFDFMSVAPWRAGSGGEVEAVGRLMTRSGGGNDALRVPAGLARFDLKTGKVLDEVPLDAVIDGTPCWLPGAARRVIFPAGGDLCLQTFPDDGSDAGPPRKIRWAAAFPDAEALAFHDVARPDLAAFGGRLLVSLSRIKESSPRRKFGPAELWWVKLDAENAAVAAAGRITEASDADAALDERLPAVSTGPDGSPLLAYLKRNDRRAGHGLRVARLHFEPGTGAPRALAAETRAVPGDCLMACPVFAPDGRSVYRIGRGRKPGAADRVELSQDDGRLAALHPPGEAALQR